MYLKFSNGSGTAASGLAATTAAYTPLVPGISYQTGSDGRIDFVRFRNAANNPFGTATTITVPAFAAGDPGVPDVPAVPATYESLMFGGVALLSAFFLENAGIGVTVDGTNVPGANAGGQVERRVLAPIPVTAGAARLTPAQAYQVLGVTEPTFEADGIIDPGTGRPFNLQFNTATDDIGWKIVAVGPRNGNPSQGLFIVENNGAVGATQAGLGINGGTIRRQLTEGSPLIPGTPAVVGQDFKVEAFANNRIIDSN